MGSNVASPLDSDDEDNGRLGGEGEENNKKRLRFGHCPTPIKTPQKSLAGTPRKSRTLFPKFEKIAPKPLLACSPYKTNHKDGHTDVDSGGQLIEAMIEAKKETTSATQEASGNGGSEVACRENHDYSQTELTYLDCNPIGLGLGRFKNLVVRTPENGAVIRKTFWDIVRGSFYRYIGPELGIFESLTPPTDQYGMPEWLQDMVDASIKTGIKEMLSHIPPLPCNVRGLEVFAERWLQKELCVTIIEVRRHRRVENFLVDLESFEDDIAQNGLQEQVGKGLWQRIDAFVNKEGRSPCLRLSQRPLRNARLVGSMWPVWTDAPLQRNAHLASFLGISPDKSEVLDPIRYFIAGLPWTHKLFVRVYGSCPGRLDLIPKACFDPPSLQRVWYGGGVLPTGTKSFERILKEDDEASKICARLSEAEKTAVGLLCGAAYKGSYFD